MTTASGKILHVFKNSLGNCRFTFAKGKDANFLGGVYRTDIQSEIDELTAEVQSGHPHIYVDPNEITIDTTYVDPLLEIKRKAVAEYLEQQAKAMDKTNDRGNTDQTGKLQGIANTDTIADAASGSTSMDTPAPSGAIQAPVTAPVRVIQVPKK
jgi:hypothetical protein